MSDVTLSTLATFDDIRRCIEVLSDGTAEEEFLRVLRLHESFRKQCLIATQETQRVQKELDASLQSMADLETKLFHARRLLEMESKARREAEKERDQLERKMYDVANIVQQDDNLKDETREKFAFLSTLPRKRKSINPLVEEKYGNEINSTGSFLCDLSLTQSEDDFLDVHHSNAWRKHRPSLPKNPVPCVGAKRSRISGGVNGGVGVSSPSIPTRRSGKRSSIQQRAVDIGEVGMERICATTKVTIPQDGNGAIRAESTIETTPLKNGGGGGDGGGGDADCMFVAQTSTPVRTSLKQPSAPPMTPSAAKLGTPSQQAMRAAPLMRQHNFSSHTVIRAETCKQCQKKIRFGSFGLRCRDCPVRCHIDCRPLLKTSCVPQSNTPTQKGLNSYIGDYAPDVPPMIPALIVHCVNEIEMRGLNEVGIYRVSGSEREVKALKERFLKGKTIPHLDNIDVHVLCGCIKDFLRSLIEPLIPTNVWKDFCNAVQNPSEDDIKNNLCKAIDALPQPNRDTLAFIILHLQRIAESEVVRMPIENLARVFGPTIVGYSSLDPDQHAVLTEVHIQFTVMLNLLKVPTDYWVPFITIDVDKENNLVPSTVTPCQKNNKESLYSIYATPLKNTLKKRKFGISPSFSSKK